MFGMKILIVSLSILASNVVNLISNYVLHVHDDAFIVELYVDDLVTPGTNVNMNLGLKKQLVDTFEIINLGLLHFFMGIQVLQMDDGIFLSQPKYASDILK